MFVRKRYCVLQKRSRLLRCEEKLGCIPFEIQEMLISETRDEDGCLLRTCHRQHNNGIKLQLIYMHPIPHLPNGLGHAISQVMM